MQFRKLFCSVLFLFGLVTVAQADPITLNVTSWQYFTSRQTEITVLSIQAVDATGKEVLIRFFHNTETFSQSITFQTTTTGLPYTATTTNITAFTTSLPPNGSVSFATIGAYPNRGIGSLTLPLGFTGSMVAGGQSLSFSFMGTGTIEYSSTTVDSALFIISVSGTGGTVTIDQATPIPEPATLLLLGSGLAAIGLKARRRKR